MMKMLFILYMFQTKIFHLNLLHSRMMKAITMFTSKISRGCYIILKTPWGKSKSQKGVLMLNLKIFINN